MNAVLSENILWWYLKYHHKVDFEFEYNDDKILKIDETQIFSGFHLAHKMSFSFKKSVGKLGK